MKRKYMPSFILIRGGSIEEALYTAQGENVIVSYQFWGIIDLSTSISSILSTPT